jgi:methyl-accepting chemotaxis protein
MKVRSRVFLLSVIGVLGMIAIAVVGMVSLARNQSELTKVEDELLPKAENLLRLQADMHNLTRRSYALLARQAVDYETQKSELARLGQAIDKAAESALERYSFIASVADRFPPHMSAVWQSFDARWKDWIAVDLGYVKSVEAALEKPSPEAFATVFDQILKGNLARSKPVNEMLADLDKLIALQKEISAADIDAAEARVRRDNMAMAAIIVVGLLLLIGVTVTIVRTVLTPLARTRDLVARVATDLDLTQRLDNDARDEIGEMTRSFDGMMEKLQAAFQSVRSQVDEVGKTVESVSTAAEQVAKSSASQSSSASAMAASIQQMTVSINTVTNSASEARQLAQKAGSISEQGSGIIGQTREGMVSIAANVSNASRVIETLGEESRQITNVVNVIKEVADQTNLLALNAAIEAARAGEQGRGFAVVADEVRKLAERTAQSTIDIGEMVDKIQNSASEAVDEMEKVIKEVEAGKALAQDADARMQDIRAEAVRVSAAVAEISDALQEQSQTSTEVARHIESIAQMSDQNNAAAEEAAANAKRLDQLAGGVNSALGQFKVEREAA